jgi:hypothetical protein
VIFPVLYRNVLNQAPEQFTEKSLLLPDQIAEVAQRRQLAPEFGAGWTSIILYPSP